jgi:hypothetical protein
VSYALRRELGDIVAAQDESVLAGYVQAAHEQGLWADVLPVVAGMSGEATPTLVNLAILRDRAVQASILAAADEHAMWGLVLPLVAMMDDFNREAVASIVASMSRDTLQRVCDAALMGEHWDTLLDLVRRMPDGKHSEFAAIVEPLGAVDPELLDRVSRRGVALGVRYLISESRTGASASSAHS